MLPIWVARDSFLAAQQQKMGAEYAEQLAALTPGWVFWALLASLVVGVLIGGYLGRATLRKHFVRAGIA
jgi:energy-coupling factor transport system substrate-specific component